MPDFLEAETEELALEKLHERWDVPMGFQLSFLPKSVLSD